MNSLVGAGVTRACLPAGITASPGLVSKIRKHVPVAALYTRSKSYYQLVPGVSCYDQKRNALSFDLSCSVVAHPPCRGWGAFRHISLHDEAEKSLAFHALDCVRACGGVLEHPARSTFFKEAQLPVPGMPADSFGGFSVLIAQKWFGHRAEKLTWLYIVGTTRAALPALPFTLESAQVSVEKQCKAERERTPISLALWLVEVARLCGKGGAL